MIIGDFLHEYEKTKLDTSITFRSYSLPVYQHEFSQLVTRQISGKVAMTTDA